MHPKCVCGRGSGRGSTPDAAGGAYSALPDPQAVFEGAASRQRRGGEGRGGEGKGREGEGGEGREGKGKDGREGKWTLATLRTDRRLWREIPRINDKYIAAFRELWL